MKTTNQSPNGTSFHGHTLQASQEQIQKLLGPPRWSNEGDIHEKVQSEWVFENEAGGVFTIYDWKQYRSYKPSEVIEWHIGAHTSKESLYALAEVTEALKEPLPLEFEEHEA